MSSYRPTVSQLDSLMDGLFNPASLASASAPAGGAPGGLDATAFSKAVDANLEPLDLKMAFGVWESAFDSTVKATQLAHDLCKVTHTEFLLPRDVSVFHRSSQRVG